MGEMEKADQALEIAQRQLAEIDRRLAELAKSRETVRAYVDVLRQELGLPVRERRSDASRPGEAADAVSGRRRAKPPEREAKMRFYWDAVDIIRAEGRPMTAPEIHALHPMRARYNAEALYRALYNRSGSTLEVHAGAFWPRGEPLPEGWIPPPPRKRPAPRTEPVA